MIRFKRARSDGSTQVRLAPMELLRRLAALVPPPGFHMISSHGVFAARSRLRAKIVPAAKDGEPTTASEATPPWAIGSAEEPEVFPPFRAAEPRERYLSWAELLRRTRRVDVRRCAKCRGRIDVVAFVTDPDLSAEILAHLGLAKRLRGPPT